MKRLLTFGIIVAVVAVMGLVWGVNAHPAAALSFPTGATINSATLWLYVDEGTGQTVRVHRVTAPWTETGVTWANFAGSYDPAVAGSFTSATDWQSVDVTQLVKAWATGLYPNYGFLLEENLTAYSMYESSDGPVADRHPYLEICYTEPGSSMTCVTLQRLGTPPDGIQDAYIWQLNPTTNYGTMPYLFTGLIGGAAKQSLLQFNFDFQPPSGCTLTPGYWKTHSKYGPASYDSTWSLVQPSGEDSPFYTSGQTYYQVLWTTPQGGNAYYILAHAYIAAFLNGLDGADTSAVSEQLTHAVELLSLYSPTSKLSKAVRQDFVNTAGILDQYNNGLIGPGHCSTR